MTASRFLDALGADGPAADHAGGDVMGMLGGAGGGERMGMIPQLMRMANVGGGHRRHRRR
jgi:hypothetical protein